MSQQNSGECTSFIHPVSVQGAELLVARNITRKISAFHETYTICACAQAEGNWRYGSREFSVRDRGSMLMEPGETHHTTSLRKPGDFKVLLISPEIVIDAAKEIGLHMTPHLRRANSDDPKLFSAIYRFGDAVETGANPLEQQTLFAACVRTFLEHTEQRPPAPCGGNEHHAVTRIKHYLQERVTESVSLDDLVALTGISRFHLVHAFAKQVGMPPHLYQINLRIVRAKELIKAGLSPIHISTDLGFSDQSHFTRHFKRVWGVTPGRYANAVRR